MTFRVGCYAVDGNTEDASLLRQMLMSATLGSQGTVGHLDCAVLAHSPATSGIIIGAGSVVVLGQESAYQGSYYAINQGTDTTLSIAATGGSPRSDMVIVRAEDPTWSSSPWGNPAAGQILFPRVLSGVAGGATAVPGGYSAIPLARIDMPADASVVQQDYITDLRQVCNPQRSTQMFAAAGPGGRTNSTGGTIPVLWPPGASWAVPVPLYATRCVVFFQVSEVGCNSLSGGNLARGYMWTTIGPTLSSPVTITPTSLYSIGAENSQGRHVIAGGSEITIPASIRGTTQNFSFAQVADGTNTGTLYADEGSSSTLILEFWQKAASS